MRVASALTVALIAATAFPSARAQAEEADGGSFLETFDGSRLDPDRWRISDGWANGDYQLCLWTRDNATVADGALRLVLEAEEAGDRRYACADVQSKRTFGHGLYEVRLRPAAAAGVVSAFFVYTGPVHGRTHEEIDFEFLGKSPESVQLNFFVDGKGGNEVHVPLAFDASAAARDYAFAWAEDGLRWYVDGELVHEVKAGEGPLPQPPAHLSLMLWNGDNVGWLGRFQDGSLPLEMTVEQVAFTAAGEPCRFEGSLACPGGPEAVEP